MAFNKNIDPGEGYRLLRDEEVIQECDEFLAYTQTWFLTSDANEQRTVGENIQDSNSDVLAYRRKLESSKPAVDTVNNTASKAFNIAASLLLGLMQQYSDTRPPTDELMKLVERFKRLRDGNDNIS
jgi:hypothetical protein